MQRERAVVAEAIEGAAARHAADECAVFALVEEGARLLAAPWRGEVSHAVFVHLDLIGHGAVEQLDVVAESFLGTE